MTTDQAPEAMADAPVAETCDVLIVGAGWAGMYMLHRCRKLGLRARVLDAAPDVGGTWYWNRYPGLRCDVESVEYSFGFDSEIEQEWNWKDRYATQAEILSYARHVADKLDLRRDMAFNTRVASARFDEDRNLWTLTADAGTHFSARFCVMATGCLSVPKDVDIPGIDSFGGEVYHTARWPEQDPDFTGKRVGVIGTGSSGIQVIPVIAEQAAQLVVFQRTPSYSVPAKNRELTSEELADVKRHYGEIRTLMRHSQVGVTAQSVAPSAFDVDDEKRRQIYASKYDAGKAWELMLAFDDMLISEDANRTAQQFLNERIRQKVKDPAVADTLTPKNQYVGTRRICLDTNYYETFNRPNVTLKDVKRHPIERITAEGVQLDNEQVAVDCLVFATGYDAMTGALLAMDIRGRDGVSLRERWSDGPRAMLGLMVAGFPNLFTITGPGSPAVFSNMFTSIEQHVEWIGECLGFMKQHGHMRIEATEAAQDQWVAHANEVANMTLVSKDNTWYTGANVPGKPRGLMPYVGGVGPYREQCEEVARSGYPGFQFA